MVLCQRGEAIASPVALVHVPTTKFHKCFFRFTARYNVGIPQVLFLMYGTMLARRSDRFSCSFGTRSYHEVPQVLFLDLQGLQRRNSTSA
jgi:hypothetical protein